MSHEQKADRETRRAVSRMNFSRFPSSSQEDSAVPECLRNGWEEAVKGYAGWSIKRRMELRNWVIAQAAIFMGERIRDIREMVKTPEGIAEIDEAIRRVQRNEKGSRNLGI